MEVGCRWVFSVTLTLIMGVMSFLSMRAHIHGVPEGQSAFIRDLQNMIIRAIYNSENPPQLHPVYAEKEAKNSVSPNLTTCSETMPRPGLVTNCCPPKSEAVEPVIDFQFPDDSSPFRWRRPAHLVDDEYVAKYRKAVSIMKSLPDDDPRAFHRQYDLHCIYCTGAYNQENSDTPLRIHRSWLFFPWHRMLLYFHERILGSLIGDDSFALPFWNWDNPDGMVIPAMYMNGSLFHIERENSLFPSAIAEMNYKVGKNGLRSQEQIKFNLALMYYTMVSGAKTLELFMGCPYKRGEAGACDGPGTMEVGPHNTVHTWVGARRYPGREDMGQFYSAARDPIFFAHHANLDRLWEVWRRLRADSNSSEITDPDWLDSHFFLHDEKKQLVKIKFRDVLNISKLRYAYEEVELPWLTARPLPSVPPGIARDLLNRIDIEENNLQLPSSRFGPHGRTLDTAIRVKVHRPKRQKRKKVEEDSEEEAVVVYGIEVKHNVYVKFDVYVNAVEETLMVGPECREFAGTFISLPHGVGPVMRGKTDLKLGISELLQDLEADEDKSIWVSLIPRTEDCVHVNVDGIRIEYVH